MVKNWLKDVLSSDKRDFYNFVPPLVDETYKFFVRFSWLVNANDVLKAKELLREARQSWGLEPQRLYYAHPRRGRPEFGGDAVLSAPAILNRLSSLGGESSGTEVLASPAPTQIYGVGTRTKPFKLPVALRRKQSVSKPTPSIKRQGAARTSLKKKRKSVPKTKSTAKGSNPAANKKEGSSVVSNKSEWDFR